MLGRRSNSTGLYFVKSLLASAVIATGLSFATLAPSPVWAQSSTNAQIEALNEMVAWTQASAQIQTDLMSLFSADMMGEMYAVLNAGDMDEIARFGQRFEAQRQAVLTRAEQQMNALPKPERWNIDPSLFSRQESATYRAALGQYNSMQETYDEYAKMSGGMSDMFINLETMDEDALLQLQQVQVRSSIRMIEIENRQIDGYLIAIEPENPNHQFQKVVKQFNIATIPEIEWSAEANTDLATRQSYGREMRDALLPIGPLIRQGRANMVRQIADLEAAGRGALSPADAELLPKVIRLYESFEETFDIEEKILTSSMSSARLYLSDESDDAISARIDENDLAFFALLEDRARIFDARLSMLE